MEGLGGCDSSSQPPVSPLKYYKCEGQEVKFWTSTFSVETILQYYHHYAILGFAIIAITSIVNITYPVYCRKLLN